MRTEEKSLVVFLDRKIRRTWFNDDWWFSVIDVVEALTESSRARKYWADLKTKLTDEGFELSEKIGQLKMMSSDGKKSSTSPKTMITQKILASTRTSGDRKKRLISWSVICMN